MHAENLTDYDLKRYHRQMMIRGFGEESQTKLKNTKGVILSGLIRYHLPPYIFTPAAQSRN